jgi:hypothetical protein
MGAVRLAEIWARDHLHPMQVRNQAGPRVRVAATLSAASALARIA